MAPVQTVTVEVPFTIRKRGGRKQVITPDGASAWVSPRTRIDSTMIKAIARGFRWRKLLETGVYGTIEEIAAQNYSLNAGRYVGTADAIEQNYVFEERLKDLNDELLKLNSESRDLETKIANNISQLITAK